MKRTSVINRIITADLSIEISVTRTTDAENLFADPLSAIMTSSMDNLSTSVKELLNISK